MGLGDALRRGARMAGFALGMVSGVSWSADGAGVGKATLLIGTIQDLSGPGAAQGRQLRDGLLLHVEEINAQGGVNGRRVRLLVEDNGGDPRRAALAARRLVVDAGVFAVLGQIGAAPNVSALPIFLQHGVISFLPLTAAPEVYEPPNPLKMAFWPSYPDQMRTAIPYLVAQKRLQRLCVTIEDSDLGRDALRGAEEAARELGLTLVERATLRADLSDVAPAVARLKAANCDLVILGIGVRAGALTLIEARRVAFDAEFLGTSVLYSTAIRDIGGRAVEGLYAVNTVSYPYADDASRLVRDWSESYRARFREDPTVFAAYGYCIFDLFAKAAARAGPTLNVETLNAVMESTTFPRDMFGSPEYHISASNRLGSRKVRVSQITKGHWTAVTTLLDPPGAH